MQVRVAGPVAAQMQAIFAEDWTYTTGEILAGDKFYPHIDPSGNLPAQAIKVSRGDSSSLAEMLYFVAIQSAASALTCVIFLERSWPSRSKNLRGGLVPPGPSPQQSS